MGWGRGEFANSQDKEKRRSVSFQVSGGTAPQFLHLSAALFPPALGSGLVCSPPLWFPFRNPSVNLRGTLARGNSGRIGQRPRSPFFTPRWPAKPPLEVACFCSPCATVLLHEGHRGLASTVTGTSVSTLRTSTTSLLAEEESIEVCSECSSEAQSPPPPRSGNLATSK